MQNGTFLELVKLKFVRFCEFFLRKQIVESGNIGCIFNCELILFFVDWLRFFLSKHRFLNLFNLLHNFFLRILSNGFRFGLLLNFNILLLVLLRLAQYPLNSLQQLLISIFLLILLPPLAIANNFIRIQ